MGEVAVLLGYKNDPDGKLAAIAKQRVDKAFEVLDSNELPVICTGGFGEKFNQSRQPHASLLQSALMTKGIKQSRFFPASLSQNTYEDGKLTSETLVDKEITVLHLITSDFHIQRGFLWMKLFMPDLEIRCHPAKTLVETPELTSLLQHEQQAIKNFYRDFPDFPLLETMENWQQFHLPELAI